MPRGTSVYDEARLQRRLWTPLNFGLSLAIWWDPTQGITMNGSTVSVWKDRVTGLAAQQTSAGSQPGISTRNGVQRLTFNGNQTLTFPAPTLPKSTTPTTYALSGYSASNGSGTPFAFGVGTTDRASRLFAQESNGVVAGALSGTDTPSTVSWTNADRFAVFLVANGSQIIRVDGVAAGSTSLTLATDNSSTGYIGYWGPYGARWSGDIGHIMAINRVLSTFETQKLEGWESWSDGKSGSNLPASHPFFSRPPLIGD